MRSHRLPILPFLACMPFMAIVVAEARAAAGDVIFQTRDHAWSMWVHYTSAGPEVTPDAAAGDAWHWGLTLTAVGYGDALQPVPAAIVHAAGKRIEYRRGDLVEWYVSRDRGVEQGFTLAAPPPGRADAGHGDDAAPLTLVQELSGGLRPRLTDDRMSAEFVDGAGRCRLGYRDLYVVDAHGRRLPAALALRGDDLAIEIDERGAAWPITVDPMIINEDAKLIASDAGFSPSFGGTVSVSGDVVVVGARDADIEQGAAYVFEKPAGPWSGELVEVARLEASDGAIGDRFGESVSISGDTIVVGAQPANDGAAYVFERPPDGWSGTLTESARLLGTDSEDTLFGKSVSVSDETIVVGAIAGNVERITYVFVEPPGGWSGLLTESARLTRSDALGGDFGVSVSISGDTVVVADSNGDGAVADSGTAYVFEKPAGGWSGTLTESAKLMASDGAAGDDFGLSISIEGDVVAAGAPSTGVFVGSAYVFERAPGGWSGTLTEVARLVLPAGVSGKFGSSVAISGDRIVVGAPEFDVARGIAYLFERPAGGWSGELTGDHAFQAAAPEPFAQFGRAVAVDGALAVAGAPFADGQVADSGAAYVFVLDQGGCEPPVDLTTGIITPTQAPLAWRSVNLPIDGHCWTIEVGPPGFACGAEEATLSETVCTETPGVSWDPATGLVGYVVIGLDPGTEYDWGIVEICTEGAGDSGPCTPGPSFTTLGGGDPFTVEPGVITTPLCAEGAPGYEPNGNFGVVITDAPSCAGSYDITITPVAGSSPMGNTPSDVDPPFISDVVADAYGFISAGAGQYTVSVLEVGPCDPPQNPVEIVVTVPDSTTCPMPDLFCPAPVVLPACTPVDEIASGFQTWVDTFFAEGCIVALTDLEGLEPPPASGGTVVVDYTATDACGQQASCSSSFVVADAPPLLLVCPIDAALETCSAPDVADELSVWLGQFAVFGGCDPVISIAVNGQPVEDLSDVDPPDACGGEVIVAVEVIEFGSTLDCDATFTVPADLTAPTVTVPGDTIIDCTADPDPDITGHATASDNCDPDPVVSFTDVPIAVQDGCPVLSRIERTWTATDACGNVSSGVQIIDVLDMAPPALSCPADTMVSCGDATDPGATGVATATDNCDDDPAISFEDAETVGPCDQVPSILRTWTATDACGHVTTCIQFITVTDIEAPEITCPPDVTVAGGSTDPQVTGLATAEDGCDDEPVVAFEDLCLDGEIIVRTWTAIDACGNFSECEQVITQGLLVLGVHDTGGGDSQLFTLDPMTGAFSEIGPVHQDMDIEGMARADAVVVGVRGGASDPDDLVEVDFQTGVVIPMVTGLDLGDDDTEVTGMGTDGAGTTWAFVEGLGFATIDLAGTVTLEIESDDDIQGVAVSPDGSTLWGMCMDGRLLETDVASGATAELEDLSDFVEGSNFENLEWLADDKVAFITSDDGFVEFSIYSVLTGDLATTVVEGTGSLDVESLVFATLSCVSDPPPPVVAACCLPDGSCADLTAEACAGQGGVFQAGELPCEDPGITCPQPCPADIDGDGVVGVLDMIAVVVEWGTDDAAADVNGDGLVDVADLTLVVLGWGACP